MFASSSWSLIYDLKHDFSNITKGLSQCSIISRDQIPRRLPCSAGWAILQQDLIDQISTIWVYLWSNCDIVYLKSDDSSDFHIFFSTTSDVLNKMSISTKLSYLHPLMFHSSKPAKTKTLNNVVILARIVKVTLIAVLVHIIVDIIKMLTTIVDPHLGQIRISSMSGLWYFWTYCSDVKTMFWYFLSGSYCTTFSFCHFFSDVSKV